MSKLSLISQALYLCLEARSSLDDLPSQADESFQFKQRLRDVGACPLNPSASAAGNITVIYLCPLTTGNLGAPRSSVVFAGHHAANEVTRKEDGVAAAANVRLVRWITAWGIGMCRPVSVAEMKTSVSPRAATREKALLPKALGVTGTWESPTSQDFSVGFFIATLSVSLEKRPAQIHPGGEVL